jgi:hypothetical protein
MNPRSGHARIRHQQPKSARIRWRRRGGALTRPPERAEAMESAMLGFSATCSGGNCSDFRSGVSAAAINGRAAPRLPSRRLRRGRTRGRLTIRTLGAMGTGGRICSPMRGGVDRCTLRRVGDPFTPSGTAV